MIFIMKDECVEEVNNVVHSINNVSVSRRDRFIIFHRIIDMNVFEKFRCTEGDMHGELKANHEEMNISMNWYDEVLMYTI